MKVLIVGGAGHVGSIIRGALEREHPCRYFDLCPVPGAEDRTTVADVNDGDAVASAMLETEAVVYLALGRNSVAHPPHKATHDINAAFAVNVAAVYRFLWQGLHDHGSLKTFIYASSLSVYQHEHPRRHRVDEHDPPDGFHPYAMSKRLGEETCRAAAQRFPQATILALRLVLPTNDADWANREGPPTHDSLFSGCATGPEDMRRLFVAALRCQTPGFHLVQCSGDVAGTRIPNTRARDLLTWEPAGS